MRIATTEDIDAVDFDKGRGLIPVVAQHAWTGELLMLAYADRTALERSLESGEMHFFSRSRDRAWHKGATSGNVLRVVELRADCDRDALCARVIPAGPACHTGAPSCFDAQPTLVELERVLADRAQAGTAQSYTRRLLDDANLRLKKIGEEAAEVIIAATDGTPGELCGEAADLLYHLLVACQARGVTATDVLRQLAQRSRRDGAIPEDAPERA